MQKKIYLLSILISLFTLLSVNLIAEETDTKLSWPLEIESKDGYVTTLYQPQLESFEANVLEGRMAVTIKPPKKELIFGAVWLN